NRNFPEKRSETAVGPAMRRGEGQLPNQLRCAAETPLFFLSILRARHCDRAPEKERANSGSDLPSIRNQRKTRTASSKNALPCPGINRLDPNDQGSVTKRGPQKRQ